MTAQFHTNIILSIKPPTGGPLLAGRERGYCPEARPMIRLNSVMNLVVTLKKSCRPPVTLPPVSLFSLFFLDIRHEVCVIMQRQLESDRPESLSKTSQISAHHASAARDFRVAGIDG